MSKMNKQSKNNNLKNSMNKKSNKNTAKNTSNSNVRNEDSNIGFESNCDDNSSTNDCKDCK